MAVYKVPQDVEAEDKLLGPFSFKQFIFLIISVAMFGAAFGLYNILLPLAIIPLPFAVFFGILALPLRKDQPMEVYFAALISFITKPQQRLWRPDGIEHLVEVVAPKVEEKSYSKGYDQAEVNRRLSYLATLVDSRGWSVRGVTDPQFSSMQSDLYNEAQATEDFLDENSTTGRHIDSLIDRAEAQRREGINLRIQQAQQLAASRQSQATPPHNTPTTPTEDTTWDLPLTTNPYPSMRQSVISPISNVPTPPPRPESHVAQRPESTASTDAVSPAIIDLARNHSDLSVASIQREANRIQHQEDEEVVISLH